MATYLALTPKKKKNLVKGTSEKKLKIQIKVLFERRNKGY